MTDRDREAPKHDRCRYIHDKVAGRVFIPGCMGAAALGPHACTCNARESRSDGVAVYVRAGAGKTEWAGGI